MIVRFVLFQCVWMCCAFGAIWQKPSIGIIAALAFVGACVASDPSPGRAVFMQGLVAAVGFLGESTLVYGGFLAYAAPWPSSDFAPAWIVALWMAFGTTLADTAKLLGKRSIVFASVLGLLFAPFSYWGAERVGAVMFAKPFPQALVAIAIVWAIAYPLLLWLDARVHHRGPVT